MMIFSRWFVMIGLIFADFSSLQAGVMQYEVAGTSSVRAFDINEHFQPSSVYHFASNSDRTLLDSNGEVVPIPNTRISNENYPIAWNKAGDIVGKSYWGANENVGFLYKNGEINYLEPKTGIISQGAQAINDLGQIVGGKGVTGGNAYLFSSGVKTDLGGLPGGLTSIANDINNSGVIVGETYFESHMIQNAKGFVVQDGVMSDLNQVTSGLDGWVVRDSLAVTSDGWIYATMFKSTLGTDDQKYRDNYWIKPVASTDSTNTSNGSSSSSTSTVIDTTTGGFWTTPTNTPSLKDPATSTSSGDSPISPPPLPVPEPATFFIWGSLATLLAWKRLR
jgi:probable HAF family extracellular repeat protein